MIRFLAEQTARFYGQTLNEGLLPAAHPLSGLAGFGPFAENRATRVTLGGHRLRNRLQSGHMPNRPAGVHADYLLVSRMPCSSSGRRRGNRIRHSSTEDEAGFD